MNSLIPEIIPPELPELPELPAPSSQLPAPGPMLRTYAPFLSPICHSVDYPYRQLPPTLASLAPYRAPATARTLTMCPLFPARFPTNSPHSYYKYLTTSPNESSIDLVDQRKL